MSSSCEYRRVKLNVGAELDEVLDSSEARRDDVSMSRRERLADGRLKVMLVLELGLAWSSRKDWNG